MFRDLFYGIVISYIFHTIINFLPLVTLMFFEHIKFFKIHKHSTLYSWLHQIQYNKHTHLVIKDQKVTWHTVIQHYISNDDKLKFRNIYISKFTVFTNSGTMSRRRFPQPCKQIRTHSKVHIPVVFINKIIIEPSHK